MTTGMLWARADAHSKAVYDRLHGRLQSRGESESVFRSVDVAVLIFAGTLWWQLGLRLQRWRALADSVKGEGDRRRGQASAGAEALGPRSESRSNWRGSAILCGAG